MNKEERALISYRMKRALLTRNWANTSTFSLIVVRKEITQTLLSLMPTKLLTGYTVPKNLLTTLILLYALSLKLPANNHLRLFFQLLGKFPDILLLINPGFYL